MQQIKINCQISRVAAAFCQNMDDAELCLYIELFADAVKCGAYKDFSVSPVKEKRSYAEQKLFLARFREAAKLEKVSRNITTSSAKKLRALQNGNQPLSWIIEEVLFFAHQKHLSRAAA